MNLIGNIKINEQDQRRIKYFFASLLSFAFIPNIHIRLTLTQPSKELVAATMKLLKDNFNGKRQSFNLAILKRNEEYAPGVKIHLRGLIASDIYLNFEEDHFCVLENDIELKKMIGYCVLYKVDVMRASYHQTEIESAKYVKPLEENEVIKIFYMDIPGHHSFSHKYKRWFIGSNSFFTKSFAYKLYNKKGNRPHDFEVVNYQTEFSHICAIPKIEILRSIDNDNEFPGSCLLKKPTPKFLECMEKAKLYLWK